MGTAVAGRPPFEPGPVPELAVGDLTAPVQRALNDATAHITTWTISSVEYKSWNRSSGGVHFVSGTAMVGSGETQWQLVLKVLTHRIWNPPFAELVRQCDDGGDGPADWSNWQREALLIDSGLLDRMPASLRTPKSLGVVRKDSGDLWLWFDRANGSPGIDWSSSDLLESAEHLGVFHARYLKKPSPMREWFCRPFVSQPAFMERLRLVDDLRRASNDPFLRRTFTPHLAADAESLRDAHSRIVVRLAELPATLCHRDLSPGNLIKTASGTLVLDWGQVGIGPPGEDLATLVLSWYSVIESPQDIWVLSRTALARHRIGMESEGWSGDAEDVALAFRLTAACHYGLPAARLASRILALPDEDRHRMMNDSVWLQVQKSASLLAAIRSDIVESR